MNEPIISKHFQSRKPSAVRLAQMKYELRIEKPECVINVGIGNVSLPTHPAIQKRLFHLGNEDSPFEKGVIRYTTSAGTEECQNAFRNILGSEGFENEDLFIQITDGGSSGMELILLGVCGEAGKDEKPLMIIDPAYTNYISFAKRIGRKTISIKRTLEKQGKFNLPDISEIEKAIKKDNPGALLVIPYDNPTGQLYDFEMLEDLARLCVKYNMWFISDEAYRELYYDKDKEIVSIWGLTEEKVPGIKGRRISVETASKVWNACGLRIGAIITDNKMFNNRAVAEYTANLCANAIGQYVFGALAHESKSSIVEWCNTLRNYYGEQIKSVTSALKAKEPKLIISSADASIYSVIDVRDCVKKGFDGNDFSIYCAEKGAVEIDNKMTTLLLAPMNDFYDIENNMMNPGNTQFRISYVAKPEELALVPELFVSLLRQYELYRDISKEGI